MVQFLLSKAVNILINPLLWIIAIQLVIHILKNNQIKKKLIIVNIVLLLFFSNGIFPGMLIRSWEYDIKPVNEIRETYHYGILPGGFSNYFPNSKRIQFNCASDRLLQTLDLYNKGIVKKIIITGGSGNVFNQEEKESIFVKRFLLDQQIPEEDLFIEDQSRNTYENARNVAALYGCDSCRFLLITSAIHMRRALPCFTKQGLNTDDYAVNFAFGPEKEKGHFWSNLMPSASNISQWNIIIKEMAGYLGYKIRGYN